MQGMHGNAWDPESEEYRCCCGNCHIKRAALIVAILDAIGIALGGINVVVIVAKTQGYMYAEITAVVVIASLILIIAAASVAALFYGLASERHKWLIPWLVVQIIRLVLLGLGLLGVAIQIVNGNMAAAEAITTGISILLSFGLGLWFLYIVFRCYRFLQDKERYTQVPTHELGTVHQQQYGHQKPGYY